MIQRPQSIFLFFAVLSIVMIMYKVPVLALGEEVKMLTDFMWGQTAAWISIFLGVFSISQFKNRPKQLIYNQLSKFALSVSFFIVYIGKGAILPAKGLFLFVLPYILLILANRFIKKDEKLVKSADRIR